MWIIFLDSPVHYFTNLCSSHTSNLFKSFYLGLEYLINNPSLTKCLLSVLCLKEQEQDKKLTDFANSLKSMLCNVSKSLETLSLFDTLMENLNQLKLKRNDKTFIKNKDLLLLLEGVDNMQSLSFLLNSTESTQVAVVGNLSAPDGNMSNKYIDCLLNWYVTEQNNYLIMHCR